MQTSLRTLRRSSGALRQLRNLTIVQDQPGRRYPLQIGSVNYQEGDRVIASNKDGKRVKHRLMSPLRLGGSTRTGLHAYEIQHSEIIGKPAARLHVHAPSTSIKTKSTTFRVEHPSLEQFVSLAPRTVTPIYSSYGATIVTLLDIHVAPPLQNNDPQTSNTPPLEILEAGTGNGGLTLHLARSIAAANPSPPSFGDECNDEEVASGWEQWRAKRRAVIHTVEFEKSRSRAAEKLIKSFRGALYWPHIDFHSGDVGVWVQKEHERRREKANTTDGFLDIVILDLPSVHKQVQQVVKTMKEGGQLLVWVPQITQVAACQHQIEQLDLPVKLDQVVELGEGISNGRRWDLRFVKPRSVQKKETQAASESDISDDTASSNEEVTDIDPVPSVLDDEAPGAGVEFPTMVCRPIVGELIMGGGFVGLWRKVSQSTERS